MEIDGSLLAVGVYVSACFGVSAGVAEAFIMDYVSPEAAACAEALDAERTEADVIPKACESYQFNKLDTTVRNELVNRVYELPSRAEFLQDREPNRALATLCMGALTILLTTPLIVLRD